MKNPTTGETHGPAVELGRALAARIGVEFVAVEYPRPGAIMDGLKTNAWDVTFLVADPDRAAVTLPIWFRLAPRSEMSPKSIDLVSGSLVRMETHQIFSCAER